MDKLEFKLSQPISVSVKGDRENFSTLTLNAPPAKEKKYPIKLRKGFMKASLDMAALDLVKPDKVPDQAAEVELKSSDIQQMLYASNLDVEKYLSDFMKLMCVNGVCEIGDEDPKIYLKEIHWDQITIEDVDRLVGDYLVNFYVSSWLPKETTND